MDMPSLELPPISRHITERKKWRTRYEERSVKRSFFFAKFITV